MASRVNGVALGAVAAGSLFLFAGAKGFSILSTLQDVVTGKTPLKQAVANPVGTPSAAAAASSTPGGLGGDVPGVQQGGPPSPNTTYTAAQCASIWQQGGGSAASSANAACHAMQESSGRSWITSPNPDGGTNVGLWQLDTNGAGAGYTIAELQNPLNNARIAVFASANGTNWSQWSTPGC